MSQESREPSASQTRDDRLRRLLEQWYTELDEGSDPDLSELCQGAPELTARLARLVGREAELASTLSAVHRERDPARPPVDRVGEFRLIEPLGSGGMGRVFRAVQQPLGRPVAVKLLPLAPASSADLLARFRREGEITAALDHPNVVPIYGIGEAAGFAYLAMKLLDGPSLAEVHAPLPAAEVARIGVAIGRALDEAHVSGVLHRDVKPSNVILDGGNPVLLDFGLARTDRDVTVTRSGTIPGTLLYMAPEQLRGKSGLLDPRCDVYSLGATLFEAAVGRPPFSATRPEQLMREILLKEPPKPKLDRRDRDLETIILRALEKDRDRRFDSAAELADDLQRFLDGEPIRSRPSGLVTRSVKLVRRHRRTTAAVAALLLVIAGLAGVVGWNASRERAQWRDDLARARSVVAAGDTHLGRGLIASLRERRPGAGEVVALEATCDGFDALEDYLDDVFDLGLRRRETLRRSMERVRRTGGDRLRRPVSDLALALGHLFLDENGEALEILRRVELDFRRSRATIALAALARGEDVSAALRPVQGSEDAPGRVDEHVITALALALAGRPLDEQQREIDAAFDLDPTHYRARHVQGKIFEARRDDARLTFHWFRGLVHRDRSYRPVIQLHLAQQASIMGEHERAAFYLRRIPESERSVEYVVAVAQPLRVDGHEKAAEAYLKSALERWPEHASLLSELGLLALSRRRWEPARRYFDRALAAAPKAVTRARCEYYLLLLDFIATGFAETRLPTGAATEDCRQDLQEIAEEAGSLLVHAADPVTRSDLLLLEASVRDILGEDAEYWRLLRESIEVDGRNPDALLRFAALVSERFAAEELDEEGGGDRLAGLAGVDSIEDSLVAARDATQRLLDGRWLTARRPSPTHVRRARFIDLILACAARDAVGFRWAYDRLAAEDPRLLREQERRVDSLRALAESW